MDIIILKVINTIIFFLIIYILEKIMIVELDIIKQKTEIKDKKNDSRKLIFENIHHEYSSLKIYYKEINEISNKINIIKKITSNLFEELFIVNQELFDDSAIISYNDENILRKKFEKYFYLIDEHIILSSHMFMKLQLNLYSLMILIKLLTYNKDQKGVMDKNSLKSEVDLYTEEEKIKKIKQFTIGNLPTIEDFFKKENNNELILIDKEKLREFIKLHTISMNKKELVDFNKILIELLLKNLKNIFIKETREIDLLNIKGKIKDYIFIPNIEKNDILFEKEIMEEKREFNLELTINKDMEIYSDMMNKNLEEYLENSMIEFNKITDIFKSDEKGISELEELKLENKLEDFFLEYLEGNEEYFFIKRYEKTAKFEIKRNLYNMLCFFSDIEYYPKLEKENLENIFINYELVENNKNYNLFLYKRSERIYSDIFITMDYFDYKREELIKKLNFLEKSLDKKNYRGRLIGSEIRIFVLSDIDLIYSELSPTEKMLSYVETAFSGEGDRKIKEYDETNNKLIKEIKEENWKLSNKKILDLDVGIFFLDLVFPTRIIKLKVSKNKKEWLELLNNELKKYKI